MRQLPRELWKAAGALLALAILLHLAADAPIALVAVGLWLLSSLLT